MHDLFKTLLGKHTNGPKNLLVQAVQAVWQDFGNNLPKVCYEALLLPLKSDDMKISLAPKGDNEDARIDMALHAMALNTPVLCHVQEMFARHGLRFEHTCGCGDCVYPMDAMYSPRKAFLVPEERRVELGDSVRRTMESELVELGWKVSEAA